MPSDTIIEPAEIDEPYLHVVAAIIWHPHDQDRFLIARRPRGKHLADYWEFPGGKLEPGEDRWIALERELHEEIGIEATGGRPFMRVFQRYAECNVLLDSWEIDTFRGEISACEGQELAWVDLDSLHRYRFPAADLPILDAIGRNE